MKYVNVTHANSKEPISLIAEQSFYISHSPAHKCTMIVSPAGAYCLVSESREEVLAMVQEALLHNRSMMTSNTVPSTQGDPSGT